MTAKRFNAIGREIWQNNEVWCVAGGEHCADVIVTDMNKLHEKNQFLEVEKEVLYENIDFLKTFIENQGFKVKINYSDMIEEKMKELKK